MVKSININNNVEEIEDVEDSLDQLIEENYMVELEEGQVNKYLVLKW